MRDTIKLTAKILSVILLVALMSTHHALAQSAAEGINLTTSPLPVNLTANPGQTVSTDLRVQNSSNNTQQIKVSLMKFSAYGESGKPALQARAPGDDYFDWVSFNPSKFAAPPGQWVTVKMTINVPKDAALGYYYAAVFSPVDQNPTGSGNKYIGSTAILVLLDVNSPNAKRAMQIADFSVGKKIYEFLPANFTIRLHNTGNVHLVPAGNIFINRGSKQIASIPFNFQAGNILPNSYRVFLASWDDGFPVYVAKQANGKVVLDKNDKPVLKLQWDFAKLPHMKFGRYTADLLVTYDNGQRDVPLEASVSFWVIPWRILIFVLLIGALIFLGVFTLGRSLFRKVKKPKTHEQTPKDS